MVCCFFLAFAAPVIARHATTVSQTFVASSLPPAQRTYQPKNLGNVSHHIVKENKSFSEELQTLGIGDKQIKSIMRAGNRIASIGSVPAGTPYKIEWNDSFKTEPSHITVNRGTQKKLVIRKNPKTKAWLAYDVDSVVTKVIRLFTGKITSHLHASAKRAGMPYSVYSKFIKAFSWQIDFNREQLKGDTWQVMVEALYADGEFSGYGDITYAEYRTGKRTFKGIRYTHPKDNQSRLYSPDGTSLQAMFIRSPVKVSKITSKFRSKRFHPILKVWRPHLGVDYAAKRGAPVLAVGDGVINFKGRGKSSGKWIKIKHSDRYETAYMHLHNFRKGLKNGSRVKQGQVIGYVGSTGSATGPHLHFAFYENGKFKDPLGKSFPSTIRLKGKDFARFTNQIRTAGLQLSALRRAQKKNVAANSQQQAF